MGLGQSPSLLAGFAKLTFRQQIAKGLVVRSDQRGYDAVGKIVDFFHDPVLGRDAAAALGVVADEGDRVMSKENYAVIRVRPASFVFSDGKTDEVLDFVQLLYKQRFFAFLLPKLVSGHKAAASADQGVYLVALSCLLLHIPRQIALTELPKVRYLLAWWNLKS